MIAQQSTEYRHIWKDEYLKIPIKREQTNLFYLSSVRNLCNAKF
jgi:hypothetical protein